jgi:hypothetical protein
MVIVVAEGAGQDLIAKSMNFVDTQDASGCWPLAIPEDKGQTCGPNFRFLVNVWTENIICPIYDSVSFIIIN